jgi:hypothetical protein
MKSIMELSFAAAVAAVLMFAPVSASACNGNGNCENAPGQNRGAPGPLVGAGLPFLAIGYGAYWLIKRRRKHDV